MMSYCNRISGILAVAAVLSAFTAFSAPGDRGPGECGWAYRIGGLGAPSGYNQTSFHSPAVDGNGNLYVLGAFNSASITIGITNLTKPGSGVLAKFTPSGSLCWALELTGRPAKLRTDPQGNCLVVGYCMSNITVGGPSLPGATSNSVGYLARFDNSGALLWGKALGENVDPYGLAVDGAGNHYVSAMLWAASVSFCGTNLSVAGRAGFCLAKLSTSGDLLWVQVLGSALLQSGYGYPVWVAADASGNSYASGTICGMGIFGQTVVSNGWSAFLAKYDPQGNFCWVRAAEGSSDTLSVIMDSEGNILQTGSFDSDHLTIGDFTILNSITTNCWDNTFVAKYDPAGRVLWARGIGGSGDSSEEPFGLWRDGPSRPFGLASDAAGSVYVAGYFGSKILNLDGLSLTNSRPPQTLPWYDGFLAKYNQAGEIVWADSLGGADGNDACSGIAVDAVGNYFATGYLESSTFFLGSNALTKIGYDDGLIARYRSPVLPALGVTITNGQLELSWPALLDGYRLETAEGLGSASSWQTNALPVRVVGLSNVVSWPLSETRRFFRLTSP